MPQEVYKKKTVKYILTLELQNLYNSLYLQCQDTFKQQSNRLLTNAEGLSYCQSMGKFLIYSIRNSSFNIYIFSKIIGVHQVFQKRIFHLPNNSWKPSLSLLFNHVLCGVDFFGCFSLRMLLPWRFKLKDKPEISGS